MTTIELLYTEPFSAKVHTRQVTNVDEVELFASDLLGRYGTEGDMLPGIDLRRDSGDSLSIAVAPFGWALVHTDTEFNQHCTRHPGAAVDVSHDVRWEEPDSVPHNWFIPRPEASAAVAQWMTDGSLAHQLSWSDDCL